MESPKITVLIAAPTFYSVFQAEICKHLREFFLPNEIALRSVTNDTDVQKERLLLSLNQIQPDALIAISVQPDSHTVSAFHSANVPIVLIDEETKGVSTITTDNFLGGRLAGEYLLSKGRKKIAVVCGRTQAAGGYNARQRVSGFKQALSKVKLTVSPEYTFEVTNYSREEGAEIMPKLLSIQPDAIFSAAGDNCALGLLTVAKKRGIRIPEDISIVGFDDLLAARVATPALTTIRQPLRKIAETAYQMVVNQRKDILQNPQKTVFKPELVIRQSA
ncbi:substrate-binding domain-containing protein [bacterium]|nr:substrate-binding domain-containing protein [bacterium]